MSDSLNTIEIDQSRCEAYGFCVEAAPMLLELDDEGYLHTLGETFSPEDQANAESAVRVCPVAALKLTVAQR